MARDYFDGPEFFKKLKDIKNKNATILDDLDLERISVEQALIQSNKLWTDFIYTFHYPHEHVDYRSELKTDIENTQPLK